MQIHINISVPVVDPLLPPEIAGKRGCILHDFQSAETGYAVARNYLPETEKFGDSLFEKMYEARQRFWFAMLKFYADGSKTERELKAIWSGLTAGNKAFTNKHGGTNNPNSTKCFWDYINGTGNTTEPMSQENLTTCGNMVILTGNEKSIGGVPYVGFWCLDSLAPMPMGFESHVLHNYFIHAATTATPIKGTEANFPRHSVAPHGTYKCNHFPNLDGRKVPVPVFSARGEPSTLIDVRVRENWLRKDRVCKLDDDENPSPVVK